MAGSVLPIEAMEAASKAASPTMGYRASARRAVVAAAPHIRRSADSEIAKLRAGISFAQGMCSDEEPHTAISAFLGRVLNGEN